MNLTCRFPSEILTFDLWGNRRLIKDPNAGTITSEYNKFNELTSQKDARGNYTKYQYDKLGRVTQKKFLPSSGRTQTINYFYDNAPEKGIGKLSQIETIEFDCKF